MDENKLIQLFENMLKEQLKPIKSQLDENTELIKALVHNSEVHKAEQDRTDNKISHMQPSCNIIYYPASHQRFML